MASPASCRPHVDKVTKANQSRRKHALLQVLAPKSDEATSYDKSAAPELKDAITESFGSYNEFVDR